MTDKSMKLIDIGEMILQPNSMIDFSEDNGKSLGDSTVKDKQF